jgi:hypothetical protein
MKNFLIFALLVASITNTITAKPVDEGMEI